MSNYEQKALSWQRAEAARHHQAQAEWAKSIFDNLVGSEVEVRGLGRCTVLAVDMTRRVVRILYRTDEYEQEFEAGFGAVSLIRRTK